MAKKIYGLIGEKLGHSFSQRFFTEKFAAERIDAEYRNFELHDIGDLMELLAEYPTIAGLNVTIPYKQLVIPYLDSLNEVAAEVGAVNVVKIDRSDDDEPILTGFNSDVIGFAESIKPMLQGDFNRKALVLGTGGASHAVVYALRGMGIEPTLVSRHTGDNVITYDDLTPEVMASHTVIVNTTPLGMYPASDTFPPIPYRLITKHHICFDLVYNPLETEFMKRAAAQGAIVKNGLEMLHLQAVESWRIWNS